MKLFGNGYDTSCHLADADVLEEVRVKSCEYPEKCVGLPDSGEANVRWYVQLEESFSGEIAKFEQIALAEGQRIEELEAELNKLKEVKQRKADLSSAELVAQQAEEFQALALRLEETMSKPIEDVEELKSQTAVIIDKLAVVDSEAAAQEREVESLSVEVERLTKAARDHNAAVAEFQARSAERILKIDLECRRHASNISARESSCADISSKLQEAADRKQSLVTRIETLEAELRASSDDIATLEAEVTARKKTENCVADEVRQLRSYDPVKIVRELETRLEDSRRSSSDLDRAACAVQEQIDLKRSLCDRLRADVLGVDTQLAAVIAQSMQLDSTAAQMRVQLLGPAKSQPGTPKKKVGGTPVGGKRSVASEVGDSPEPSLNRRIRKMQSSEVSRSPVESATTARSGGAGFLDDVTVLSVMMPENPGPQSRPTVHEGLLANVGLHDPPTRHPRGRTTSPKDKLKTNEVRCPRSRVLSGR
jgi:predicted nuclease with TOPRIM domain